MKDRIFELRNLLGMSQIEFGSALGLGQATIAMMESDKRRVLERHILLVCKIFGVRETWLRTGKGLIFDTATDEIDVVVNKYGWSEFERNLLIEYSKLSEPMRKEVIAFADRLYTYRFGWSPNETKELSPTEINNYRRKFKATRDDIEYSDSQHKSEPEHKNETEND